MPTADLSSLSPMRQVGASPKTATADQYNLPSRYVSLEVEIINKDATNAVWVHFGAEGSDIDGAGAVTALPIVADTTDLSATSSAFQIGPTVGYFCQIDMRSVYGLAPGNPDPYPIFLQAAAGAPDVVIFLRRAIAD